jgi:putative ABC transport system permease protein
MINSFVRVQRNALGADARQVLTFDFRFAQNDAIKPYGRYRGVGLWDVLPLPGLTFDRVLERIKLIPGVTSAAGISRSPLNSGGIQMQFLIEGRPAPPPSAAPGGDPQTTQTADYFSVTPNYFATMKIPILRGRDITAQDTAASPLVIVINQTFARRFFANDDPIGKRMTLDFVPDERPREIVAVVGDTRSSRMQQEPSPTVYVPHVQQTARWPGPQFADRAGMYFLLRTPGDPLTLVESVKRAVAEVDPSRPAANFRTVEQNLSQQTQFLRLYILLLGVFGGIAAVLAAIGIYGVMAYAVTQRTREIGIRMALGAAAHEVIALVGRRTILVVVLGLVTGLAGALAATQLIQAQLWDVTPTDPTTFALVSLLFAVVALVAAFFPMRRAVSVDPTIALRCE